MSTSIQLTMHLAPRTDPDQFVDGFLVPVLEMFVAQGLLLDFLPGATEGDENGYKLYIERPLIDSPHQEYYDRLEDREVEAR